MCKKCIALLLALALLLSLCACGKEDADKPAAPEKPGGAAEEAPAEMVPGYISQVIELPEGCSSVRLMTLEGDKLLAVCGGGEDYKLCALDLGSESWSFLPFDGAEFGGRNSNGFSNYGISGFDAYDGVLWMLVRQYFMETGEEDGYHILRYDCATGEELSRAQVGFEAIPGTESPTPVFSYMVPLGGDRAAICDHENAYIIDSGAQLLETLPLSGFRFGLVLRLGDRLYVTGEEGGQTGVRSFDMETYALGPMINTQADCYGYYVSEKGEAFLSQDSGLVSLDVNTGETSELFKWLDVAIGVDFAQGGGDVVQSAAGDYYMAGMFAKNIQKVSPGLVKDREVISLRGVSDLDILNAALRFNSTNEDYKIEYEFIGSGHELSQQEILELVLQDSPDIVYTPSLPQNSIDAGLFVDLLPYIDADESISQEDFIAPVLESMIRKGGLYELITRVDILGLSVRAELFPGREEWTMDYVEEMVAERPAGTPVYFWHRDQNYMLNMLCRISSGDYVDWESGKCSFDEGSFASLLRFVKDCPYTTEPVMPVLMEPVLGVGYSANMSKSFFQGDYEYAGFPGTSGNGSYFTDVSGGYNKKGYGIMASSEHKEAAWDFLRLLLLPENIEYGGSLVYGIPVTTASFDKLLEKEIREDEENPAQSFTKEDADKLRELVYSTEKMARQDDTLTEIISTEAAAYFAGDKSLEDTVSTIQSRASIYVAEQAG